MSRQIDWTKPLSEEDEAWAAQFSLNHPLIALNKEQHGGEGADTETLDGEPADVPAYTDTKYWTKARLMEEAGNRELAVPAKATRDDLVALMEADDAAAEPPPAE